MDENIFERWIFNVSRLTIIIPLFVLAAGVFIRVSQNRTVSNARGNVRPTDVVVSVSPVSNIQSSQPTSEPINLDGPLECTFSTNGRTGIAYIKNKKVLADVTTANSIDHQKILLNGDTLYMWQGLKGQKMNGVSQYIDLLNMFGGSNLLDISTLLNFLPKDGSIPEAAEVSSMTKSCVKKEVNDALFIVPTNVQFVLTDMIKP